MIEKEILEIKLKILLLAVEIYKTKPHSYLSVSEIYFDIYNLIFESK